MAGKGGPYNTRYRKDLFFFHEPNLLNCYWAGFLAADGILTTGRDDVVSLGLQQSDKGYIEKLCRDVQYDGPILLGDSKSKGKSYPNARVNFYGVRQWVKDLRENFRITPRKSFTLISPDHLWYPYNLAFIAGYIDGDGGIYKFKTVKHVRISIRGTKAVLTWIKDIFDGLQPVQYHRYSPRMAKVTTGKGDNGYPRYSIAGERALRIIDLVKSLGIPLMERKWGESCRVA